MRIVPLALTLGLALGSQGPDADLIRAARGRFNRAIAEHDTTALGAEWAADIQVISSRGATATGAAAYRALLIGDFGKKSGVVYVRTPDLIRILAPWDQASEEGRWVGTWKDGGRPIEVRGRYLAQWRKREGRWRLASEYFVPEACRGGSYCERP